MRARSGFGGPTPGRRHRGVKRSQGYVLISALVVIALIMAAGALLAGSLQYRMWLLRQEVQSVRLTALTDAGLAFALDRLSRSHFWDGVGEQPLDGGAFAVGVEMGGQPMTREVTVTATWGPAGRAARAVVLLSDFLPPRVISWQPVAFNPDQ